MENKVAAPQSKANKAFMILSALGIIFVIDAHMWTRMSFFTQLFPYDSFFMPMFMFISGYFFKEKYTETFITLKNYVIQKFKKLMLPYLGWIVFYGVFTNVLRYFGIINFRTWEILPLLKNIVCAGTSFGFNDPSWFVPILFYVTIVYAVFRKLLQKIWKEPIAMLVLFALGTLAVFMSNTEFNDAGFKMLLLKTLFFLQFYELGIFFKKYLEPHFDKINGALLLSLCVAINIVCIAIYGNINFPQCAFMSGFKSGNVFLPFITSVTGIAFWLKVSKILAPALGNNRLVNFVSDNTFFIMTHHLTFKGLFNGIIIMLKAAGLSAFSGIDAVEFKKSAWYVFSGSPWIWTACFFFTLATTLLGCYLFGKLKSKLPKIKLRKK